MSMMQILNSI